MSLFSKKFDISKEHKRKSDHKLNREKSALYDLDISKMADLNPHFANMQCTRLPLFLSIYAFMS